MTNENSVSEHYQTTGLLDTIQDTLAEMLSSAGFKSVAYQNLTGGIVAIHTGVKT